MSHPLVHFELLGPDTRDAVKCYANVFDWTISSANAFAYPVIMTGRADISGGFANVHSTSRTVLYFFSDDQHRMLERAEAAGGYVESPIASIDRIRVGRFIDISGNVTGVFSSDRAIAVADSAAKNQIVGFELAGDKLLLASFYRSVFGWRADLKTGVINDLEGVPGRFVEGEPRSSAVFAISDNEIFSDPCKNFYFEPYGEPDLWIDGRRLHRYRDTLGNVIGVVETETAD